MPLQVSAKHHLATYALGSRQRLQRGTALERLGQFEWPYSLRSRKQLLMQVQMKCSAAM